jgi:hypothetical protein
MIIILSVILTVVIGFILGEWLGREDKIKDYSCPYDDLVSCDMKEPCRYCPDFNGKEYLLSFKSSGTVFKEGEIVCNYTECEAGMGVAGNGKCYLNGNAKDVKCKKFKEDTHE